MSKYVHHLPLYRQEQIYWRQNRVWLPRQNLAHWVELAAEWLKPIYERIRTGVMGGGYVQVDESPVRFLSPGNGKAKTGYFWTASRPGGDVFYHWETSRAAACLGNVLPIDFKARCNAMAIRVTRASPVTRSISGLPGVGRTCDEKCTLHATRIHSWPDG